MLNHWSFSSREWLIQPAQELRKMWLALRTEKELVFFRNFFGIKNQGNRTSSTRTQKLITLVGIESIISSWWGLDVPGTTSQDFGNNAFSWRSNGQIRKFRVFKTKIPVSHAFLKFLILTTFTILVELFYAKPTRRTRIGFQKLGKVSLLL